MTMWLLTIPLKGPGIWLLVIWSVAAGALLTILDQYVDKAFFAVGLAIGLSLPAWYLVTGALMSHTSKLMKRVSEGHSDIPIVGAADVNPLQQPRLIPTFLMLAALIVAVGALGLNWQGALAWLGVAALITPLWTVAMLDRFSAAMTPSRWWLVFHGLSYLYPAAVVTVALAVGGLLFAVVSGNFIALVAGCYGFLLGHTLLARLLWMRRSALGLYTEVSPEQDAGRAWDTQRDAWLETFDTLHKLCRAGKLEQARTKLEFALRMDDYALDDWVFETMENFQDDRLRLEHAHRYIGRLVERNQDAAAWSVFQTALDLDAKFRPQSSGALIACVSTVAGRERMRLLPLLEDFEVRYPDSEHLPDALVLLAELKRDIGDVNTAKRLLLRVRDHYPKHAELDYVRDLARSLKRSS